MNNSEHNKYLNLFSLSEPFTEKELKEAYRDLAHVWHPDKHGHNERLQKKAEKKFQEINDGYDFLKKLLESGFSKNSAYSNSGFEDSAQSSSGYNKSKHNNDSDNSSTNNSSDESEKDETTYNNKKQDSEKGDSPKQKTSLYRDKFGCSLLILLIIFVVFVIPQIDKSNNSSNPNNLKKGSNLF